MPQPYPPDDPREWMNRACSNLAMAKSEMEGIYIRDAVQCHFEERDTPRIVRLHMVKEEVFAL